MILNSENNNNNLSKLILSDKAFSVIRLRSETDILTHKINSTPFNVNTPMYENNGGLYPSNSDTFNDYAEHIREGLLSCDGLVYWQHLNSQYENYSNMKDFNYMHNRAVEPFYFRNPWSQHLEGKKVLVIHPFTETIKLQYSKRQSLFDNNKILPDFELITYKSIQTSASNNRPHETWSISLKYMINEINEIDFDIALIGCGCYDIPLSTHIKNIGKQSIIIGGGLQLLFGIKGGRWDKHGVISKLYNDNWTRPSNEEKPNNFNSVEGGCYW